MRLHFFRTRWGRAGPFLAVLICFLLPFVKGCENRKGGDGVHVGAPVDVSGYEFALRMPVEVWKQPSWDEGKFARWLLFAMTITAPLGALVCAATGVVLGCLRATRSRSRRLFGAAIGGLLLLAAYSLMWTTSLISGEEGRTLNDLFPLRYGTYVTLGAFTVAVATSAIAWRHAIRAPTAPPEDPCIALSAETSQPTSTMNDTLKTPDGEQAVTMQLATIPGRKLVLLVIAIAITVLAGILIRSAIESDTDSKEAEMRAYHEKIDQLMEKSKRALEEDLNRVFTGRDGK